ncbi:hypothetical protein GR160_13885 [Flavobacterium sp. Sd200]|uniref:nSTAND1 domain-containing NTPase n=1 Tax=Flavobacterium sp. Sd200 TaxID=2692211 RepID=UPI001368D5F0|nr:hypothetical protein [Flavobacterium sp. Sd200]MXN92314.1 hypothetical protein [Flavobacterium sp. Sd200]
MTNISSPTLKNRYPGVRPFSEHENNLFFGRLKDIEQLKSLIFINQTIVLHGKSGYGKSSIINAGIIPQLRKTESWNYFHIRFNNYSEKKEEETLTPFQTVKQRLLENIDILDNNEFNNVFADTNSFWHCIKQNQLNNKSAKYIIFFDQFEELFTYPKKQVSEFSEQLSQLLYSTIPSRIKNIIDEMDEQDLIPDEVHDILYQKPEIKVVFSIRSDRLSLISMLTDWHPNILKNCYELDALTYYDAINAITEPAKLEGSHFKAAAFTYTDSAVEKILLNIANTSDKKIEASTLQIVCRYIEETLVVSQKHSVITDDLLGNIADIFQQYYEAILTKLNTENKLKVQRLIEDELIDDGKRHPLSKDYIINRFKLPQDLLFELEQSSLLSKERDASGRMLYEISHDSLVIPISKVALKRREQEEREKRKQIEFKESEKKKRLEKQLEIESKKSSELLILNKRLKRTNAITKLFAAAFAIVLVFACYTWKKATEEEYSAKQAKKESDILQANSHKTKADDFFAAEVEDHENFQDAIKEYNVALKYVDENDSLYKTIKNKIEKCKEKLPQR